MNFKTRHLNCTHSVCDQSIDHANPTQFSLLKGLTVDTGQQVKRRCIMFRIQTAFVDKGWLLHLRTPNGAAFMSETPPAESAC